MKRQKQKAKRTQRPKAKAPASGTPPPAAPSRRGFLKTAGSGALVVAALGAVGWYFVEDVRATVREEDLSRIGQGVPTVVQIHDPQCPRCLALQREARDAMEAFEPEELQYLVANIKTEKGRRLARQHDVGHVTLLLFDAKGNISNVLVGNRESEALEPAFRRLVRRSGS
ncbi:MAG: hypothetical protein Kilf2KO_17070 [Rhodospirillales bacterium]